MKVETSAWKLTQKDQEAQITTLQSQNRANEDVSYFGLPYDIPKF